MRTDDAGARAKEALQRVGKRKLAPSLARRTRATKRVLPLLLLVGAGALSLFSAD